MIVDISQWNDASVERSPSRQRTRQHGPLTETRWSLWGLRF